MESEGTSSASESSMDQRPPPAVRPTKRRATSGAPSTAKRNTTYYLRKDEIQSLRDQVKSLEEKLAYYEQQEQLGKLSLPAALVTNESLHEAVEQTTLRVAGAQSMMSAYNQAMVHASGVVPLRSYIHLPRDQAQRDAVLSSMYETKLRSAVRFMAERTRFLDLRVRHKQSELFELPGGEVIVVALDVVQFDSGHSLRQVYDALMNFVSNQEIVFSEELDVLSVRESEEVDELKFCNTRLLSSLSTGDLEVETNTAMFATCVDGSVSSPGYAVGLLDFVDQDDLYPYRPEMCVRKEVTGAITLNELPSVTGGKPTIAMARWSHVRMPPPTFPLSEEALNEVRTGMLEWCSIIPKIVKERLAVIPPAP